MEPTLENANTAKRAQVAEIIADLFAIRDKLSGFASSELAGEQLWPGGLPQPLMAVDSMVSHNAGELERRFGIAPEAA